MALSPKDIVLRFCYVWGGAKIQNKASTGLSVICSTPARACPALPWTCTPRLEKPKTTLGKRVPPVDGVARAATVNGNQTE